MNDATNIDSHPNRRNLRDKEGAELKAQLQAHPGLAEAVIEEMAHDLGRVIELTEPVYGLFPKIEAGHIPGILLLLNRVDNAAELAALLAKISLEEEGKEVTPGAIQKGVDN